MKSAAALIAARASAPECLRGTDLDGWLLAAAIECLEPFFDALWPTVPNGNTYCDAHATAVSLPRGAIVAVCELKECAPIGVLGDGTPTIMCYDEFPPHLQAVQEPERSFGLYTAGRWAWPLASIRALPEPIPAKGKQGLWNYEGEL